MLGNIFWIDRGSTGALYGLYRVSGTKIPFGVWGVLGAILIANLNKRVAQRLHRIMLLHFGPVTFKFHFPKVRKVFIFTISGLVGNVTKPHKPLLLISDLPN